MTHHLLALVLLLTIGLPVHSQSVLEKTKRDELLFMDDEEPEMRKAFERARASLDDFLKRAEAPAAGTSYYALKVGVREGKNTEYFWIGPFSREGTGFSGVLDNTPRMVKSVREGQLHRFPREHIVDWTYFDRNERRMYGNFTMCALLTKEPPSEAENARRKFGLRCE